MRRRRLEAELAELTRRARLYRAALERIAWAHRLRLREARRLAEAAMAEADGMPPDLR